MDLTTRCPECGTTFKATLAQLQLRKGYIRCVHCAHIFDGYEAVVPNQPEPAPEPAREPAPEPAPAPRSQLPHVLRTRPAANESQGTVAARPAPTGHTVGADAPLPASADEARFTISTRAHTAAQATRPDPVLHVDTPLVTSRPEPAIGHDGPDPVSDRAARSASIYMEPRHDPVGPRNSRVALNPNYHDHRSDRGALLRLFWTVLVVVGMLVLAGQLAYIYRAQLANNMPVLRPVLERACIKLQCQVPYSRQIDQISIMSSALRAGPRAPTAPAGDADTAGATGAAVPAATDTMSLHFTLRNTYDKPQEWPTLQLDLTDFSGTRVVRKNLPPSAYLAPEDLQNPFPAGSELTSTVPVALNGVKVNGFQLEKFFQ